MPTELTIAPPATATSAAPSTATADPAAGAGDFVSALAEALNAEAAVVESMAPIITAAPITDELDTNEELLDAQAMFADPQALLMTLEQAQRVEASVQTDASIRPSTVNAPTDRTQLAALTLAATSAEESAAGDALLESTSSGGRTESTEVRSEAKVGGDHSAAAVFASNAGAHERVTELRERPVIRSHVGTSSWTEEIAGKLTLMVGRGMQSASLQLSPEHLGPLEIRISVANDNASVWFGAAHAETRAALENALPRLRELLAGQGLNLSDAGVFKQASQQQQNGKYGSQVSNGEAEREFRVAMGGRGLVDAYA